MRSEDLSSVPPTSFTERAGVNAVASTVNDARCIWRETPFRDVGIDGQVEYVTPSGAPTGRLVLVQVKNGASYFRRATAESVPFSPEPKHRGYWEGAPLPVVLVLFNPDDGEMIWTDARHQLRVRNGEILAVPRRQSFDVEGVLAALSSAGQLPLEPAGPEGILTALLANVSPNPRFPLSFFDLFVNGLTDACLSLYFGMVKGPSISIASVAWRDRVRGSPLPVRDTRLPTDVPTDPSALPPWVRRRPSRGAYTQLTGVIEFLDPSGRSVAVRRSC